MARTAAQSPEDLIDVRRAAALVGRHPETIRRWIRAGRLAATRRGRRLLVAGSAVLRIAGATDRPLSLRAWLELRRAPELGPRVPESGRSTADLVLEDRRRRANGRPGAGADVRGGAPGRVSGRGRRPYGG